jgi:uncharacterized membrane protein
MSPASSDHGLTSSEPPPPSLSSPPPQWRLAEIILLSLILAVAASLRFHRIGVHSFWIDEFFTVEIVNGSGMAATFLVPHDKVLDPAPDPTAMRPISPWWHILWPDGQDNHPPLFYLLTRAWVSIFGYTEAGFRSHAAAWSLVAIVLVHLVLRWRSGVTVGLWAAALMALAEPQIQLAQNARSYPMFEAICLWACLVMTSIEKRGVSRGRWWALMLLLLTSLLTHYVAFGIIAALGAYALLCLSGRQRRAVAGACAAAMLAFVLIWGWGIRIQSHGQAARDPLVFRETSPHHVWMTLYRMAQVPAQLLNEPPPQWRALPALGLLLLPLAVVFMPRRREALLWVLWFAGGVLPATFADLARNSMRLDITRYTIIAAPAVYALIAGVTSGLTSAARHWLPATALLSCAVAVPIAYEHASLPDWRRFGKALADLQRPGDLVVVAATSREDLMYSVLYTCGTHYGRPLKGPIMVLSGPPTEETWRTMAQYRGVVVVTNNSDADGICSTVHLTGIRYFPAVGDVYRFDRRSINVQQAE